MTLTPNRSSGVLAGVPQGLGAFRDAVKVPRSGSAWRGLTPAAKLYVWAVVLTGTAVLVAYIPRTYPEPVQFAALVLLACLTSTWKVHLSRTVANGSTLSVSYAAHLTTLLLLGSGYAVVVAVAGVLTQCTYKATYRYPLHRTAFSMAAAAITMAATGAVYGWLGGSSPPSDSFELARPLVGAISTYYAVNTGLVAAAISLSTFRPLWTTWREDFLWTAGSFVFAGTAGALAALVLARGDQWKAVLLIAPVYLTYRTYELFVGRIDDQRRHTEEIQRLHQETLEALQQAREAERALAGEKERLGRALADMTRLEDAREQLLAREQSARATAEEASRLKDQFLAIVSHELRTPLNAILGWADMLSKRKLDEEVRARGHRTIYESARRQAQLIEDLLDVARISSGKLRLDRALVSMQSVMVDALQVIQPGAEAKRIRISIDADPELGAVYGDAARLQQIIWNLLSNAVKFTPADGWIRIRLGNAGDHVELGVTDSGEGIAPEFLPSVFHQFRQADASTTRVHSGLGLGLSIVKTLVEAHGGTVSAFSEGPGRGASFTVRLPAVLGSGVPRRLGADALNSAVDVQHAFTFDGVTVLVVDDDEGSRDVVAAQLQLCGAMVLCAASAEEAFTLLDRKHVDVLLADIGMPGEDGYSMIRRIRSMTDRRIAAVPAAALTAFAREADRDEALTAGFQLHLPKPIQAQALLAAVGALLVTPTASAEPQAPAGHAC